MMQLTFDIHLSAISFDILPNTLREHATSIRFLRFGLEGFLLTCRVAKDQQQDLVRFLRRHYRRAGLNRFQVMPEGHSMIRIRGEWFHPRDRPNAEAWEGFAALKALERSPRYSFRPPEVVGDSIRITMVAEAPAIRRLGKTLDRIGVEHTVRRLAPLENELVSSLDLLTAQQRRVLGLAHSLGYYDIPRRATTEQIARRLKMNKGTVGRHMRRAEKHLLDWLLA